MNASDLSVAYISLAHLEKTKALPEGAIRILRECVVKAHAADQAEPNLYETQPSFRDAYRTTDGFDLERKE